MDDDSDGHSPRLDVAAFAFDEGVIVGGVLYADDARFLALEAKRLPAPTNDREREYLIGKRGGVERFKRGYHAGRLKVVGIIAYLQRDTFVKWQMTINCWVDELIATSCREFPWDARDKLDLEEETPRIARFQSSTLRVSDRRRLSMRHLWVQLASDKKGPAR